MIDNRIIGEVDMNTAYKNHPNQARNLYESQAFSRNIGILTPGEMERLKTKKIAIPGMGGVGGQHLVSLARIGIHHFHIADFDQFNVENTNRQYGAKIINYHQAKTKIMAQEALDINPYIKMKIFAEGIKEDNLDAFLQQVDVVVDGLDFFCLDIRRKLFARARELLIPVITVAPIAHSGALLIFTPTGMSFDQYFNLQSTDEPSLQYMKFLMGLTPQALHRNSINLRTIKLAEKSGPSLNVGCTLATSLATTEVLRILLDRPGIRPAPHYLQFDANTQKLAKGKLTFGLKGPWMQIALWLTKRKIAKMQSFLTADPWIPIAGEIYQEDKISPAVLASIVHAGVIAPSGDNCGPWRFDVQKDYIDLYNDPQVDHSIYNFRQIASFLAAGAAAENIAVAASYYGLDTRIHYQGPEEISITNSLEPYLAKISFHDEDKIMDPQCQVLNERHTNRTFYQKKPIPMTHQQQLLACGAQFPELEISLVTNPDQIKIIGNLIFQYDILRSTNRQMHEHLMANIHYSETEARKKTSGFHYANLDLSYPESIFTRLITPWQLATKFFLLGGHYFVAHKSRQAVLHSGALILIKGPRWNYRQIFNSGRLIEKVWLQGTMLGHDLQPMAMPALMGHLVQIAPELLSPSEVSKITQLDQEWQKTFAAPDFPELYFILRIGQGRPVPARTLRYPLAHYFKIPK